MAIFSWIAFALAMLNVFYIIALAVSYRREEKTRKESLPEWPVFALSVLTLIFLYPFFQGIF